MEFIRDVIGSDAQFGIAEVKPSNVTKKCRARHLSIEYFLTDYAIFLVTPRLCMRCARVEACEDDFILQIIEKFNQNHKNQEQYFLA
ncbi:MAG: hypothetical protein FWG55_02955 [Candidatus Bathyarchaeota archaeon]|nr:hypothetical protein [Candidatus Termiticorpusculum sp.]